MEEKNTTKISLSTFFLMLAIIIIIVMGIFMYKLYNDKSVETEKSEELQTQVNSLNRTISDLQGKINTISEITNSNKPTETEIHNTSVENKISIDEKKFTNMISSILDLKDFDNVNKLSEEDCLNAVWRKLYRVDESNKTTYTVTEINSYVKELFGRELTSKSSSDLLKYNNGKYEMVFADGDPISKIRNIKFENKDDKVYATFDVYTIDVGDNEEDVGKYTVTILQDSSSKNVYINSKVKN